MNKVLAASTVLGLGGVKFPVPRLPHLRFLFYFLLLHYQEFIRSTSSTVVYIHYTTTEVQNEGFDNERTTQ